MALLCCDWLSVILKKSSIRGTLSLPTLRVRLSMSWPIQIFWGLESDWQNSFWGPRVRKWPTHVFWGMQSGRHWFFVNFWGLESCFEQGRDTAGTIRAMPEEGSENESNCDSEPGITDEILDAYFSHFDW